MGELKKALPAHCFTPDLSLSFYYVLKDLVIMIMLYVSMLVLTEGREHMLGYHLLQQCKKVMEQSQLSHKYSD